MTFGSPIGSSLYLIFLLIDGLSLSPITGADDPDDVRPPGKANCHDTAINNAEAEVALLALAMRGVLRNDTLRIPERTLGVAERNPCFSTFSVFFRTSQSNVALLIPHDSMRMVTAPYLIMV